VSSQWHSKGGTLVGVEIKVEDLTKSFGKQLIWGDVTLSG